MKPEFYAIMEDLTNLMTYIDQISGKIPENLYLEMMNSMKRIHASMSGNIAFHEDTFYYTSDEDNYQIQTDYPNDELFIHSPRSLSIDAQLEEIDNHLEDIRDVTYQMQMAWNNMLNYRDERDILINSNNNNIRRITYKIKQDAIEDWCERNKCFTFSGEACELVGHENKNTVYHHEDWKWDRVMKYGLSAILYNIGSDEDVTSLRSGVKLELDDITLKTYKCLIGYEESIYSSYKSVTNHKREYNKRRIANIDEMICRICHQLSILQESCASKEEKLSELGYSVPGRDHWNGETMQMNYQVRTNTGYSNDAAIHGFHESLVRHLGTLD
jgi:hypothetical protein